MIDVDGVAEGLWQTITEAGHGIEAHKAWLALAEAEKQPWREWAKVAIASWKEHIGLA